MLAFNVLMLVGWAYVLGAVAAAAVASAVVHGQVQSHKDFRIVVQSRGASAHGFLHRRAVARAICD
jgi:hypothetical protein